MQLDKALDQISEIRQQMAQAQVFRGYRSATTATSAVVALAAAGAQSAWVPQPLQRLDAYLLLWLVAAGLSIIVVGVEMTFRCRRSGSSLQRQATLLAVDQFVPCLVAGALVTYAVAEFARDAAWMLPGLWAVLFSLGVFASRRFLPRGISLVGAYYLLAGLCCLALGRGANALSPWIMAATFGGGQLLAAAVLYWTLERGHGRE